MNSKFSSPIWVIILILVLISGFQVANNFPPDVQKLDLYFFQIDAFGFSDVSMFLWFVSFKVILIIILLFWFFSCSYWWRMVIFVPLTVEFFKLFELLNSSTLILDETNHIKSLPFTLLIGVLLIYFLWKDYNVRSTQILLKEVDQEIDDLIVGLSEDKVLRGIKDRFETLKNSKEKLTNEEYTRQLLLLKKEIGTN